MLDADRHPDRRVVMPIRVAPPSGTPECVVAAGWQASDSVPPRLTASLKICSAFRNANASASPPSMSKEKVEPGAVRLRARTAWRAG